jgi:hypothetical protein
MTAASKPKKPPILKKSSGAIVARRTPNPNGPYAAIADVHPITLPA